MRSFAPNTVNVRVVTSETRGAAARYIISAPVPVFAEMRAVLPRATSYLRPSSGDFITIIAESDFR
jgi:hypothetical protein